MVTTKSLHEKVWKVQQSSRTLYFSVLQRGFLGAQARVQHGPEKLQKSFVPFVHLCGWPSKPEKW